jgi:hypothetical protein
MMNRRIDPIGQQMRERLDSYLSKAGLAVVPDSADGSVVETGTRGHQIITDPVEEWVMVQTTVWVKSFKRNSK